MVRHTAREKVVRDLAAIARTCGVEAVRGDAARNKVIEMRDAIRNSEGDATSKQAAEDSWKAYEVTFPTEDVQAPSQGQAEAQEPNQQTPGFRLLGKSFLFTYDWDFLGKALPDGTPLVATVQI